MNCTDLERFWRPLIGKVSFANWFAKLAGVRLNDFSMIQYRLPLAANRCCNLTSAAIGILMGTNWTTTVSSISQLWSILVNWAASKTSKQESYLGIKLSWARGSETHVRGSARKGLRKQTLIVRSRKGRGRRFEYRIRFISPPILHNQSQSISSNAKSICRFHEELAFAEAPRKQNQLTNHPRKLKLWWQKQRGRPRGRQVRL